MQNSRSLKEAFDFNLGDLEIRARYPEYDTGITQECKSNFYLPCRAPMNLPLSVRELRSNRNL